jgi:hypothetical protein
VEYSPWKNFNMRLVGSQTDLEGYLQVKRNSSWLYPCVEKMDITYAQSICEQLNIGNILKVQVL